MDIKWRSYSHLLATKIIAFMLVIVCFTGVITSVFNVEIANKADFDTIFEENYFSSRDHITEADNILRALTTLTGELKSKEYILSGGSITLEEIENEENNLFSDYMNNSKSYNPNLSHEENYVKFQEVYAEKITQERESLIKADLKEYNMLLKVLEQSKGIIYYATDGEHEFKNTSQAQKNSFKVHPSYMLFEEFEQEIFPQDVKNSDYYHWLTGNIEYINNNGNTVFIGFTDEFLNPRINEWKSDKEVAMNSLYTIGGFTLGLIISFIYLVIIIGRKGFGDKELQLNTIDRLYNDINIALCILLIGLWITLVEAVHNLTNAIMILIPLTAVISSLGLILVLSLIKHLKNRTIIKHTLIFTFFYRIFKFFKDVYDSGSVAVKIVLIVIGYPVLVAATFFMFPITLGLAAWLALKKVKEFNAIKEGVEIIKSGDIHHNINVAGKGEFGKLATNINTITHGLKKAVDNELKSERLKTELITNVSHDIRTPLTSIITYVDLLKSEKDPMKVEEYVGILEQKSQRLKNLTDDLFEAAKASSGNIPVDLEKIDIVSLITQGLGELNDRIEELELDFKINYPKDKVYVLADGKLLWRAIENLLSNIFKYGLRGSRVYVNIEDLGHEVNVTIKNISEYELNISADELMERFKRGDEARNSQGSGLGLSIAKSLIDIQRGRFNIEIDGDLFKAIIFIPKYK